MAFQNHPNNSSYVPKKPARKKFFKNRYRWYSIAVIFALLPFLAADTGSFAQTAFTSNVEYSQDIIIAKKPILKEFSAEVALQELASEIPDPDNQINPTQVMDESIQKKLLEAGYDLGQNPENPTQTPGQEPGNNPPAQITQLPLEKLVPKPSSPQYTNRLVFSKVGITAPVLWSKLDDIFEKNPDGTINFNRSIEEDLSKGPLSTPVQRLLTKGVVHMSFSTAPGNFGNSYIIGHSSNYQSVKSDYNRVFEKLKNAKNGDQFVVYDQDGRELKFKVFENIIIDAKDSATAYQAFSDRRVVTLQASVLVNGKPTKRQLVRGELQT